MPEAYKAALEIPWDPKCLESFDYYPGLPVTRQQAFVAGGTQSFNHSYENNDRQVAIQGQHYPDSGADNGPSKSLLPSTLGNDRDGPHYSTHDEAEAAFIKLLRRSGVAPDWTWDQTMRAIIKEPQYRALKDPRDRRAAFEKYIVELKQQEQEKAKDRITKLRQDFAVMLKSHPEIKHYTRWRLV